MFKLFNYSNLGKSNINNLLFIHLLTTITKIKTNKKYHGIYQHNFMDYNNF